MKIRWSNRAVESLSAHLSYLQENWGQDVVVSFLDRVEEVIATISTYPKLYASFDFEKRGNISGSNFKSFGSLL